MDLLLQHGQLDEEMLAAMPSELAAEWAAMQGPAPCGYAREQLLRDVFDFLRAPRRVLKERPKDLLARYMSQSGSRDADLPLLRTLELVKLRRLVALVEASEGERAGLARSRNPPTRTS